MEKLSDRLQNLTPLQRAVYALQETKARLEALEKKRSEPIAIVGMACRFPGGATDPQAFWKLLCDGVDAIGPTPADRWDAEAFYDSDPSAPGKMNTRWGGFLERVDEFDNHFFGISDREAARIDPQQRMLLELAWEAFEDGGLPPSRLRGSRVGVFVGISLSDYGMMLASDVALTDAYCATGTSLCLAANRLSFLFGLNGPSLAIDTACSSSLVAVHLACQSLRNGEAELALAGGTSLLLSPIGTINLTKAGFSAGDGRVRAFDAAASGYVRGEGAGLVVLKPLSAAVADGDAIYAVIRGSAVNQNGASNGLTAPSGAAQERVLREAYTHAGISPAAVQYVETQGTGTPLGDAIEASALGRVLKDDRPPGDRCSIGSVKTNIGHLEAAAGVASLMKAALALCERQLPPSLHFHQPNPDIPFESLPLKVQQTLDAWPNGAGPRIAGVSAFGFGGSNSHVVLQEAPPTTNASQAAAAGNALSPESDQLDARQLDARQPGLLVISARTDAALRELAGRYRGLLAEQRFAWGDICYSAAARREHHDCRLAVLSADPTTAGEQLDAFAGGRAAPELLAGRKPFGRDLKVAWLFDSQLTGWRSCAGRLLPRLRGFREAVEEIDTILAPLAGRRLTAMIDSGEAWQTPAHALAVCGLQLALAAWWRRAGLVPSLVVGRGLGELSAAVAAGLLTADEALRIAASIAAGEVASSSPLGPGSSLDSPPRTALVPFLSAFDGRIHRGGNLPSDRWLECRDRADGLPAVAEIVAAQRADVLLEIGPPGLLPAIRQRCCEPPETGKLGGACGLASLDAASGGDADLWQACGELYVAGCDLAWERIFPAGRRCVRTPAYAWQRQRLWAARPVGSTLLPGSPTAATQQAEQPEQAVESSTSAVRLRPELNTPFEPPRTPLEQTLAEVWAQVLGLDRVGIHDDFFELGGDSLQAAILLNEAAARLGRPIALPLIELFQARTVAAVAERVDKAAPAGDVPAIVPISRDGHLPLSLNQEALWFLDRLEPERPTYTLYLTLNVRGPLSVPTLERALSEIVRRHESLRTTFPEAGGQPVQRIAAADPRRLPVVDLRDWPAAEREAELLRRVADELARPIDLQNGPLIHVTLLQRAVDDWAIVISTHHIIHDGWSMGVLLRELAALYPAFLAGKASPLAELPIQYVDFAAWQRKLLQGERLKQLQDYWRGQLTGVPPLELPTDHPRPAIRTTRGDTRSCQLSSETSRAVLEFCRREGVTPYMVLLAAFQVLLARYSGQTDFAVGSPVANRNQPQTEALIGYFVNVVVLRASLSGDPSFRELVARVRQIALDAFQRQEMTLDQVVDAVRPARDLSRNPLFQVMFALQNIRLPAPPDLGLAITPLADSPAPPSANFDLTLELFETEEGFRGGLNFATDLFRADSIDRLVQQYGRLLEAALREPERGVLSLPLIDEAQRHMLLERWNATARAYDRTRLVHRLFEAQARQRPEAPAVFGDGRCWSYRELNERSNRLARFLRSRGVRPEVTVGIRLPRSPELVMAVLAVIKAGGAYVPLDPAYSRDAQLRMDYMIQDARLSLIITTAGLDAVSFELPQIVLDGADAAAIAAQDCDDLSGGPEAENLAYILYTSGSTGRPKGVMIEHGSLLNAYYGWEDAYELAAHPCGHLQMASFGFDVFAGDFVRALCSGGKLVLCDKEILLSPQLLIELMRREAVAVAEFVPLVLRNLTQHLEQTGQTLDFMRLVIVGSDAWYAADHRRAQNVIGPHTRLINSYGLTETTIDSCWFEGDVDSLPDSGLVPIGRPLANVRLYVLDDRLQPAPIGVPGELYIGGDGVARGYVQGGLNAVRFIEDPFEPGGDRLCRTGDRARRRGDGQIEFLGRADDQLKIRGFRVEPGEVEELLAQHPLVAQAAVAARQRTPGDVQLVAYVVTSSRTPPSAADLKQFLAERLPEYMLPAAYVPLDALPSTASGKVDRQTLPEPDWGQSAVRHEYLAPRTETEQQLAQVLAEVLNVRQVGLQDSFFDLGGNSLLAIRLVSRVREVFSVDLPLVALFAAPRLGELAERIQALIAAGGTTSLPPIRRRTSSEPAPLSFAQEPYWRVYRLFPDNPVQNIHAALPLLGPLDVDKLRATIQEVTRRHEVFRTRFLQQGGSPPVQVVGPVQPVELPVVDLSHLSMQQRDEQTARLSHEQASATFDLSQGGAFRICLLRLGKARHVMLVTIHHMIFDGWSLQVLAYEVAQLYEAYLQGRVSPLPELPIQYADFAVWQREHLKGPLLENLMNYWRQRLEGLKPIELPTDRPWVAEEEHLKRILEFEVPADLRNRLNEISRRSEATSAMLHLAAFKTLLHRYSGADDVAVLTPAANRRRREIEGSIGLFLNSILIRTDVSGDPTFGQLLGRVRTSALGAYEHQEMPFELLVNELAPDHDPRRFPLVRHMFNYHQRVSSEQAKRRQELQLGFLPTDLGPLAMRFVLTLTLAETDEGLNGILQCDRTLYEASTLERIAGEFLTLLKGIAADPEQRLSELTLRADRPPAKVGGNEPPEYSPKAGTPSAGGATGSPLTAVQPAASSRTESAVIESPAQPLSDAAAITSASEQRCARTGLGNGVQVGGGRSLVLLCRGGRRRPLFCIHGLGGHIASLIPLAQQLAPQRPAYGLQASGLDAGQSIDDRIEAMAERYAAEILGAQPDGPYLLGGWSLGGLIALDTARQLAASGASVALVAMFDTHLALGDYGLGDLDSKNVWRWIAPQLGLPIKELQQLPPERQWAWVAERAERVRGIGVEEIRRLAEVCQAQLAAAVRYRPLPYAEPAVLFRARTARNWLDPRWNKLCPQLRVESVDGDHYSMLQHPAVETLGRLLARHLAEHDIEQVERP